MSSRGARSFPCPDLLIHILKPIGVKTTVICGEILFKRVTLLILVRPQAAFSESVIAASFVMDFADFDGLA